MTLATGRLRELAEVQGPVGCRVDGRWELASASDGYDAPCTPQQREAFEAPGAPASGPGRGRH